MTATYADSRLTCTRIGAETRGYPLGAYNMIPGYRDSKYYDEKYDKTKAIKRRHHDCLVCKKASFIVGADKLCTESCPFNSCIHEMTNGAKVMTKVELVGNYNFLRDSSVLTMQEMRDRYNLDPWQVREKMEMVEEIFKL